MDHASKGGEPKILSECDLPLTGRKVVHRIITDLAVIDVTPEGLVLREVAPGVSARDVQERTEPTLKVASDRRPMSVPSAMAWPEKNRPTTTRARRDRSARGFPPLRRLRRDAHRRRARPPTSRCARSAGSTTSSTPPLAPPPARRRRPRRAGTRTSRRPTRSIHGRASGYPERVAAVAEEVEGAKESMEIGRGQIERAANRLRRVLFAFMGGQHGLGRRARR